ncbi:phosphatidylinositol 4-phosphate 3-kinase C2 domain-containing subunit beta isoform X1 [Vespula squamosa]|uniref:Phosphatidylinositol 4-phosphate 3-kinase C2 domain-containing subunit beta isoform X1 n=1 Tax=Vespula squamosa TaxID=30214 RepID=A0ABD2BWE2_VESSQ
MESLLSQKEFIMQFYKQNIIQRKLSDIELKELLNKSKMNEYTTPQMTSSGISGVTMDAVSYVQKALLPGQTNPEAAATFARMIESSLKSWFTQFNFFLHNLAQLRFSGDHNDGALLSFIPRTYTMQQEGQLTSVQVHGYQKRYDPEKYYMYILRIQRKGQADPTYLFRSYKEFCEFYQKLCIHFPLAKVAR